MKKFVRITSFLALIVSLVCVSGCISQSAVEPNEAVANQLAALQDEFKNTKEISKNLALPTGSDGVTITWESSNPEIIGNDGTLAESPANGGINADGTLPEVTLKATISHKKVDEPVVFELKAKVSNLSNDAKAVKTAYAVLLSTYEGVELTGYQLSFVEGSPVYGLDFVQRGDCTITYTNSEHITFNGGKATITRPTDSDYVTDQVATTITAGSVTINVQVPVLISKDSAKYYSIAEVREVIDKNEHGSNVFVFQGTVTMVYESTETYQGFYLQDGDAAIYVYSCAISSDKPAVAEGDYVLITSTVTNYSGLYETSAVSALQILAHKEDNTAEIEKIHSLKVNAENFNATDLKGKDGSLVNVEKLYFSNGVMTSGSSASLTFLLEDYETKVTVRVDKYTSDFDNIATVINGLKAGDVVKFNRAALGWYTTGPQFSLIKATDVEKVGAPTDADLANLDAGRVSGLIKNPQAIAAESDVTLKFKDLFGATISYALGEETDSRITIEGDKLKVAALTKPVEFDLIVTYTKGEATVSKTVKCKATPKKATITEVKTAVEGSTFAEMYVGGVVVDILENGFIITDDGTNFALVECELPDGSTLKVGDSVGVTAKTAVVNGGILTIQTEKVEEAVSGTTYYVGNVVEASAIAPFKKLQVKELVVASGAATVGEKTCQVVFAGDLDTPAADGTYKNVEGYCFPVNDTTIKFVITGVINSFAEVFAKEDDTPVRVLGRIVGVVNGYEVVLADENGDTITVNADALADMGIKYGDFIYVEGTAKTNYSIKRIAGTRAMVVKKTNITLTWEEVVASVVDAHKITNVADQALTATAGHRDFFTISGLTYKSTNSYGNIFFTTADGKELNLVCYSGKFNQQSAWDKMVAALKDAIANPDQYTITITISSNFYDNKGTTVYQGYPVVESIVVTKK